MAAEYKSPPIQVAPGVYAIPGPTNVGFITDKKASLTEIYLIDTGGKDEDGLFILNRISDLMAEKNEPFVIKAIINTHSHADHCGGNKSIQERTGCEIWTFLLERGGMENPAAQGDTIWGGNAPLELKTPYYRPKPTVPTKLISESDRILLSDGRTVSFLNLPGHYYANFAVICRNKENRAVVFAADAIFPRSELSRYWIPFMINPDEFMSSLDKLCDIKDMDCCVPGHGDFLYDNIQETAELDKIAVLQTKQAILQAIENEGKTFEQILKYVADKNSLNMKPAQYMLVGSTIRSYIAVMRNQGIISIRTKDNLLLFSLEKG